MSQNTNMESPVHDLAELAGQLEAWLGATDIAMLELRGPGVFIRLQAPAVQPTPADAMASDTAAAAQRRVVRAGSVGVLRLAHPLRAQPLVHSGQAVRRGQALALLQIGAVLLPVCAPCDGTVGQWLAQDASTVGYGTPLLDMETEASDAD
jgi:acetyl-CoA carboxylase biotin carboxyl carrier protein